MKLGWWSHLWMIKKIKKVSLRSPGVTQGQAANHCCMDMKLDGWSHLWMLTNQKVSSRSFQQCPIWIGFVAPYVDWWDKTESYLPFLCQWSRKGQEKVHRGRNISLPILYGFETWWLESSFEAEVFEGQFKVTRGSYKVNWIAIEVCTMTLNILGIPLWMLTKSEGQFKVTRGHPRSNGVPFLYGHGVILH